MSANDIIGYIKEWGYMEECITAGIETGYFFEEEAFADWLTYVDQYSVGAQLFGKRSEVGKELDVLIKEKLGEY